MSEKSVFTIAWKIVNFSLNGLKNGEYVTSPVFSADNFKETKWFLQVYPKGCLKESEGFISFYLVRDPADDYDKGVTISYKLEIIDFKGEVLGSKERKDAPFSSYGSSWGFAKFLKEERLTNNLENGYIEYFVFRCQAFSRNDQEYCLLYQAQTEYLAQVYSLKTRVLLPDFQKWSENVCFPFKTKAPFFISFTASGDDIIFNFKYLKTLNLSLHYKVNITILDEDNVDIKLEKEQLFKPTRIHDSVQFEAPFKKHLIKSVKKGFPLHSFSLKCIFSAFNKDPITTIESYSVCSDAEISNIFLASRNTGSVFQSYSYNDLASFDPPQVKEACSSILDDLKGMLLNKEHCDVKLRVDSKIIPAHKGLLSARSPVFSAMFNHDMIETETGIVDMEDVDCETLQSFLECLYTDTIEDTDWEKAQKLILVADKYQVSSLKDRFSQILMSQLSELNACKVFSVAELTNQQDLKDFTINFIRSNKKKILSSPDWSEWVEQNMKLANKLLTEITID